MNIMQKIDYQILLTIKIITRLLWYVNKNNYLNKISHTKYCNL